jgi:hypothetical protein
VTVTSARASWLFLRLLGFVYVLAFWSLATQVIGLIGHDGILPAREYMDSARQFFTAEHVGLDRYWILPTLCWLSTTDTFLRLLCLGGIALGVLLAVGVLPALVLPLLWLDYLSLSVVSREFLSYQWDALLLEAGFLAILIAPLVIRERSRAPIDPPRLGVWLMLWLTFRLMFGSGVVKLASGDPTWHSLTALSFHYETQPIPTPVAWYAHQLPAWVQMGSTAAVLAIELIVPFFILGPRRLRRTAFVALVGLQAVIALTGNYAFFNLLAAALCVWLLDDRSAVWRLFQGRDRGEPERLALHPSALMARLRHALLVVVAVVTVPVSAVAFAGRAGIALPVWPIVEPLADAIAPFRSVNTYGLFAVMTTERPEIIVEGSDDGITWRPYEFAYKAGDMYRRPPWAAPHQPRLDWQMWFAALGRYDDEIWLQRFCQRLLDGSPDVLRLLGYDPFAGRPPRYVRAVLYRYRFSDRVSHQMGRAWWTRERIGDYSPVLSRGSGYESPARE